MDLEDKDGRQIRLADERFAHLEFAHPEMRGQDKPKRGELLWETK